MFRNLHRPVFLFDADEKPGGGDPTDDQKPTDQKPDEKPDEKPTDTPDAGDTFSADYVAKLRKESAGYRTRAQAAEGKLQEQADAKKTDDEKLAERLTAAEERAAYADRLDVALDKAPEGMSVSQVRKLAKRLTGKTREELEADAEELFSDFAPKGDEEKPGSTPRERLRPGAAPSSEPEETDPRALAAKVDRY